MGEWPNQHGSIFANHVCVCVFVWQKIAGMLMPTLWQESRIMCLKWWSSQLLQGNLLFHTIVKWRWVNCWGMGEKGGLLGWDWNVSNRLQWPCVAQANAFIDYLHGYGGWHKILVWAQHTTLYSGIQSTLTFLNIHAQIVPPPCVSTKLMVKQTTISWK